MTPLRSLYVMFMVTSVYSGSLPRPSGISQFWTDDFKVFDQVYGKTSDKELYGTKLPPSTKFDAAQIKLQASEKNERYLPNVDLTDSTLNSYFVGDRYAKLFAKSLYDDKNKPSSALQFINFSDFKPISEDNDPETYKYLKNLESRDKYKIDFPEKGIGGFKPYSIDETEASDAYRSIQDILDAHEANKGKNKEEDDEENDKRENDKRNGHKEKRKNNNKNVNKNRNKVRSFNGNRINTRCNNGRCRKRNANAVRYSVPYIRKIQRIRYSKR